jgi:uncharacterized repeat protein (TIGR01451 family)
MADFFMVDKDQQGRVFIAYNENSDLSHVLVDPQTGEFQYIGKPIDAVLRLRTGPSLFAAQGNLLPDPRPANVTIGGASLSGSGTLSVSGTQGLPPGNWSSDPAGDAPFPVVPVASANHPALDILEASAGDNGTNLTLNLKMADLSSAALADAATTGGAPSWVVTWWEAKGGIGPSTMAPPFDSHWYVKWKGGSVFEYGIVSSIDAPALGAPTPKYLTYTPSGTTTGTVNGNQVTISVPLANLGGLTAGDKLDHVAAYTFVEHTDVTLNDWADQAKTFSYRIGTPVSAQHLADGYVQVALNASFTSPVLATLNPANNTWTASILGAPATGTIYARQILSKDLYTPLWDDVRAGPVAQLGYNFGAAVTIDKSTSPANQTIAHLGQAVTFLITVTNTGPADATGLTVVDTFTKNAGFVSTTSVSGTWSCVGKTTKRVITCTLSGTLARNATAVVQVVLKPTTKGTRTNTACESASPGDAQDCDHVTLSVSPT